MLLLYQKGISPSSAISMSVGSFFNPVRVCSWVALSNYLGETNLKKAKALLLGISVIYFNDESKNIYADLPPNKEQVKRLSKRIY